MIPIQCACGETYHADEQHVGRKIQCSKCGKVLMITGRSPLPKTASLPPEPPLSSKAATSSHPGGTKPVRLPKAKSRLWKGATIVLGLVTFTWISSQLDDWLQANSAARSSQYRSTASRPITSVVPPPATTPLCPVESQVRPISGTELGGKHQRGLGSLKISNGTGLDAVATLNDDTVSTTPRLAIFVRNGESATIASVPIGTYRLRFQFGTTWLQRERKFCLLQGKSEFDKPLDFSETKYETEDGYGTRYATHMVTLNPVLGGNAKTHALPDTPIELPPL